MEESHLIVLYCISLGPPPVGVQCPLTSSLGECPGYWDWLMYPGLTPVLVSIAPFSTFAFHTYISVFFHSVFTCHSCFSFTTVVSAPIRSTLADGEFPGLGLALVPDVLVPGAEHGVRMKQKSQFKFLR